MSRKPHEPTEETRQAVRLHATVGTDQETIARVLMIDAKTLRKYYRDELDISLAMANAQIGGALFSKAKGGDTTAMIFWMKTRALWRTSDELRMTGGDGGAIETKEVGEGAARIEAYLDAISSRKAGESSEE